MTRPSSVVIGDITVATIHEHELDPSVASWLMPELDPTSVAVTAVLSPPDVGPDGALRLDSHSFALEVGGHKILVDTGIGNGKVRANPLWNDLSTGYLEVLAEVGFAPDSIDTVILTHLHTDHVGWNTVYDGNVWRPTFPNARYLVSEREWDFWNGMELDPERAAMFADSILPVRDSGQLDTIVIGDLGECVAPGITLVPAPGHTPGQVIVEIESRGEQAVISADAIHHPIQVFDPSVSTRADVDPAQTVTTRRRLLSELADRPTLLLGTHFAGRAAGFVERSRAGGYRWAAAENSPS